MNPLGKLHNMLDDRLEAMQAKAAARLAEKRANQDSKKNIPAAERP